MKMISEPIQWTNPITQSKLCSNFWSRHGAGNYWAHVTISCLIVNTSHQNQHPCAPIHVLCTTSTFILFPKIYKSTYKNPIVIPTPPCRKKYLKKKKKVELEVNGWWWRLLLELLLLERQKGEQVDDRIREMKRLLIFLDCFFNKAIIIWMKLYKLTILKCEFMGSPNLE